MKCPHCNGSGEREHSCYAAQGPHHVWKEQCEVCAGLGEGVEIHKRFVQGQEIKCYFVPGGKWPDRAWWVALWGDHIDAAGREAGWGKTLDEAVYDLDHPIVPGSGPPYERRELKLLSKDVKLPDCYGF